MAAAGRKAAASAEPGAEDEGPADIDTTMKPLLESSGVVGYFIVNEAGIPIKWSSTGFEPNPSSSGLVIPRQITHYACLIKDLVVKAQDFCNTHATGPTAEELRLRWLRLRTNDKELVIAPGATCTLVLVHKAHAKAEEEGEDGDGAE